jgi:hypothetical protein
MSTQPTVPGASMPVDEHLEERVHVLPPLKTFDTTNFSTRAPASPTSPQNKSGFSKVGRTRSASRSSVTGIAANNTSQFVSLATAANGGDATRTGAHIPPTYIPATAGQDGLTRLPSSTSFRRVTSRPPIGKHSRAFTCDSLLTFSPFCSLDHGLRLATRRGRFRR